jgi:hypothetical protein
MSDRTIRVKVKREVEYISLENKNRKQLLDAVWVALRSKKVPIDRDRLQAELDNMIWKYVPPRDWY